MSNRSNGKIIRMTIITLILLLASFIMIAIGIGLSLSSDNVAEIIIMFCIGIPFATIGMVR